MQQGFEAVVLTKDRGEDIDALVQAPHTGERIC